MNGQKVIPPAQIGEQKGTGREAEEFKQHSLYEKFSGDDTGADVGKFANE